MKNLSLAVTLPWVQQAGPRFVSCIIASLFSISANDERPEFRALMVLLQGVYKARCALAPGACGCSGACFRIQLMPNRGTRTSSAKAIGFRRASELLLFVFIFKARIEHNVFGNSPAPPTSGPHAGRPPPLVISMPPAHRHAQRHSHLALATMAQARAALAQARAVP